MCKLDSTSLEEAIKSHRFKDSETELCIYVHSLPCEKIIKRSKPIKLVIWIVGQKLAIVDELFATLTEPSVLSIVEN